MRRIKAVFLPMLVIVSLLLINADDEKQSGEVPYVLQVQSGHADWIQAVAFSPDGVFAISGSVDYTLKLWHVASGKELRTFYGHTDGVNSAVFSPDGAFLLSGSADKTLILWDVARGTAVREFTSHAKGVYSVAISPDGRFALSGAADKTLKLWEIASGREIRTLTGHSSPVKSVAFSPDGRSALSGAWDNTIVLWDVAGGKEIRRFDGHSGWIDSVAFSPDGKYALSASRDKTLKLWDIASGKEIRRFTGHSGEVLAVAFSPDGASVVSGSKDKTLKLWDAHSGRETASFQGHSHWVTAAAFSPDGESILSGSMDHSMRLWSLTGSAEIKTFTGRINCVSPVAFSSDGRFALSGTNEGTVVLWDVARGRPVRFFKGHPVWLQSLAFSPDGGKILAAFWDDALVLWDAASGEECRTLSGHGAYVYAAAMSMDGRYALSGSGDTTLKLWDLESGREIRTLQGHTKPVYAVAISPDGRYALSGSGDTTLKLWDLESGKEIRTLQGHAQSVYAVAFSPDGRCALSGSGDTTLKLWDLGNGKEIQTFRGHAELVSSVAFSRDGKLAVSGSSDAMIKLWDTASGREIRTLAGHHYNVNSVAFSPDGRKIVSGSSDATTRIWDIDDGRWTALVAASTGPGASGAWIAFTDDGYWDAANDGGGLVAMVRGMDVWNIDQFAAKNNRPDIILQRLGSGDRELIAHYRGQYLKRLRKLGLAEAELSAAYAVPEAKILSSRQEGKHISLTIAVSDAQYQLRRYNIFVNDVPLFGAYGKAIQGKSLTLTERIELTAGDNKIEVSCMNQRGAESFRALTHARWDGQVKGDLYFIGFGVSQYRDASLNLAYAHKDVLDLAAVFSGRKDRFANVFIYTFVNAQVTVKSIREAKKLLGQAKPDDTLVLFIAGHGVHDVDAETTYYFLTYETDLADLAGTAANFELVEDLLQGVPPRNKLFLIDTCEAGEAEEGVQLAYLEAAQGRGLGARVIKLQRGGAAGQTAPARTYLAERDRFIYNDLMRRSGAIVFSACRGGEFSYESTAVQNGFFTEKILEALDAGTADKNRDGAVSVDELREYVMREVPLMTADAENPAGLQHPTVDRDNIYRKFGF